jgi:hypothetical protein
MDKDAGLFYEISSRLRRQLSRHHWTLGKPFTPIQEDAWRLLNEVDQVIKIMEQLAKWLPATATTQTWPTKSGIPF